jgi:CBS-domain-containing membrane protein
VVYVYDDQEIETAARVFEARQIRRLPVLNREKKLVGILSLGDLALHATTGLTGEALREVSQPPSIAPVGAMAPK